MALKSKILKPSDFINPLLSKKKIDNLKFENFKTSLEKYKLNINSQHSTKQSEPNIVANALKPFFEELNYNAQSFSQKGQSGIDLAIMKDFKPCVILEAKKHNDTDMINKENLHKKSLYEAILYFLRERDEGNKEIFHIIITDFYSWFVFDAKDFDRLFWQNSSIKKIYKNYKNPNLLGNNTKDFYEDIEKELNKNFMENSFGDKEIPCAYFNLLEPKNEKDLQNIYKLLSSDTLLKEFNPNDANSLNKDFYNELLYILGLEEKKEKSKKLIQRASNPQAGTFYENIVNRLKEKGESAEFEKVLELIIIWINRILFLKLLESQIVSWDDDAKKFLNIEVIKDYQDLQNLFFDILANKIENREDKSFNYIPYLNSSLFEIHETEKKYIPISHLKNGIEISYYSQTALRDDKTNRRKGKISTLDYLFDFLNSYSFGEGEDGENKTLINASVLGLIFEKINGYKDGSFFTPSFITIYMARESLENLAIERFNKTFEIECSNINELIRYCEKHSFKDDFINKANEIINSITICDPAVGSGHFLVSALNEIIFLKYRLGLFYQKGLTLNHINDELLVRLDDEWFTYKKPKDYQNPTHKLQKMLFEEKQRVIENQLFGVDLNPNSTQITKLRLWIELLKNSFYDENSKTLVTLPNIDINIKTGNSLISRFDLDDKIKINNIKHEIKEYKKKVKDYKNNIGSKKELLDSIKALKDKFKLTLKAEHKLTLDRDKKLQEYVKDFGLNSLSSDLALVAIEKRYGVQGTLFDDKKDMKKEQKLKETLLILQDKVAEVENGKIYENAFEWRFEFPEVLDEDGNFLGFDIVLGNPPYIMEYENKSAFDGLREQPCYQGKTDIWHLFTCLGLKILKQDALISFIAKNQWLESQSASNMRKTIYENGEILKIIDFGTNMVFEEASQQTMIFLIKKNSLNKSHKIKYKKILKNLSNDELNRLLYLVEDENIKVSTKEIEKNYDEKENLTFSSSFVESILNKIEVLRNFEFDEKKEIIQGIIGGPDEAFIINSEELTDFSNEEKEYLKMLHTNTGRYSTDDSNKYIFYLSAKNFNDKNIDDYPNIKNHFEKNKKILIDAKIRYETPNKLYFYLHRERDESFFKEGDKLVWAKRTYGERFTFTKETFYGTANLFFIKTNRVNLKYITSFLNSKLLFFYMHEKLKHTGDLLQLDKNQFMKIPIYVPKEEKQQPFIELVDKILALKKESKDTKELEEKIDELVYELYGLTDDEIKIIKSDH